MHSFIHTKPFFPVEPETQVVIIADDPVVNVSSTVLLTCVGYGVPVPSLTWSKMGTLVVNDSMITIIEEQVTESRIPFAKSVLEICGSEIQHSGRYTCTAQNELMNDSAMFELTVDFLGL